MKNAYMWMNGLIVALLLACLVSLGYAWSFTDTDFGGWFGTFVLPAIGILLFLFGVLAGQSEDTAPKHKADWM